MLSKPFFEEQDGYLSLGGCRAFWSFASVDQTRIKRKTTREIPLHVNIVLLGADLCLNHSHLH